ncbi:type IV pilus assembly protein PilF [Erwinia toletana]|uniref:Type IV pilus assembly protein PilF n=1 Tax=Winslowiella toletana TaxID=92490 RepID=A0ABS4P738_9GAMM|nr:type IV pilus biogenesis/stability protein PilW [Winslowiella toletana]MBP2167890.1 type IV pilus assembly protein PilF [Winslowiella toletana]
MRNGLQCALLSAFLVSGCVTDQATNASAQTRLQLGLEYLARGDIAAAQRNLQRAEAALPQDYRVQLAMARLYQMTGDNSLAQLRYDRALNLAPLNSFVVNNYGAFLCGLGQYDAAQQQFSQAQRLPQPGARADSFENAGYCYLNAGEFEQAKRSLLLAVQADGQKGAPVLAEAEKRFGKGERAESRLLLDVYQHSLPASAESLWLEIRFAALVKRSADIERYGTQLARNFPQSIQHQHFLANEY